MTISYTADGYAAQDFVFTVLFSGGNYNLPMHLGPRVTHLFNLSEIVQNQTPDSEGNVIPAEVHEGSAKISGRTGRERWMRAPTMSRKQLAAGRVANFTIFSQGWGRQGQLSQLLVLRIRKLVV